MGAVRGEGCERYLGYSILELVLQRLKEAGFQAAAAYPGQKFPQIREPKAAVHIEKVDRANMTVTVEISIVCPAAMGGTACELEALRATEVLRSAGAVCVQNGCSYDGVAQVYVVSVLASFTGVTEADKCTIWPGFYCYVGEDVLRFAVSFTSERTEGAIPEYAMGVSQPVGSSLGSGLWEITLEEQIPCGSPEVAEPQGEFTVQIVTEDKTETYSGCRWTSVLRQRDKQGLRRVRTGFAQDRTEEANG